MNERTSHVPERRSELPPTPSMVPPPPPSRGRRALRVVGWSLFAILVLVASFATSLVYHVSTSEARSLARVAIEELASGALRGDLDIGRVDELTLGRARFTNVVLYDDQGRMVISIPELTVWPDLDRILEDGTIRIAGAHATRPFVQLYTVDDIGGPDPNGLEVSLVRAFQPTEPGDPNGEPTHIVLDGLQLEDATVVGDAPRFPGLVVQELDVVGRIEIEQDVLIQVFDAHGRMTAPYGGDTHLDRAVVRFTTDWDQGLDAYLITHREGSRADARVQVTRPDGDEAPPHVWIRAHVDPLEMATLDAMGLTPPGALTGRVHGHAVLEGPADHLVLTSSLETDGGPLAIDGTLGTDGHYHFAARSEGLDLDAVVARVPPMLIAGEASIDLDTSSGELAAPHVTIDLEPFVVEGYVLPSLRGEGRLEDGELVVETIHAPGLEAGAGGEISGEGRVGYDGTLALELQLDVEDIGRDPNVARLVPGAHGAVHGSLRVASGPRAADLAYDFDVDIRNFRYGPVRARRLLARGFLRGDPARPVTRITTSGEGLRTGTLALGRFRGELRGGPSQYEIELGVQGGSPIRAAHVAAVARSVGDGSFDLVTDAFDIDPGLGRFVQASPIRLRAGRSGVRFDSLELEGARRAEAPAPRVSVAGSVGAERAEGLVVEVTGYPLESLAPYLSDELAHLDGRLDGVLRVDGDLDAPSVSLRGAIAELSFDQVRAANVSYQISHEDGVLQSRIEGTLGDRGTMLLEGPTQVSFAALTDSARFLDEARFDGLRLAIDQVGVPFVLPLLGIDNSVYDVSGKLSVSGELRGTIAHPSIPSFVMILDRVSPEGWTPLRVKLELALEDRDLRIERLWLADVDGEIALAQGRFVLPLDELPSDRAGWISGIAARPWELAVRLEPRLLEEWPRPLSKTLPHGVRLAGSFNASGGPEGAHARADASLRWVTPTFEHACARHDQPVLEALAVTEPDPRAADARHRRTQMVATMFADQRSIGTATFTAETPLDAWLAEGRVPSVPETLVAIALDDVPLGRVPWTCPRAAGRANGHASLRLFSSRPSIDIDLDVDELRIRDEGAQASRPYHVALRASTEGADWTTLASCAVVTVQEADRTAIAQCPLALLDVEPDSGAVGPLDALAGAAVMPLEGEAIVRASVPVRFSASSPVPEIAYDRALYVEGRFSEAHLEPLLVVVPGISQADAIGDGEVVLRAVDGQAQLSGGLDLSDGRARILALGQHLHEIEGMLLFRGNRIVIDEDHQLRAADPAGRIAVDGEIGFEGIAPAWADLHVFPDGFPFRREGAVLASLAGHAGLRVRFEEQRLSGQIRTSSFEVRLPDHMAGSVMDLEARRDVLVIGEDAFELTSSSEAPYPYVLHLDATEPFTVHRNDFEAELTAELDIEYADPDLTVTGNAVLRSGTFEVFGKRFAIARGSLLFLEEAPLDPVIDLVATYALPGRSGSSISIEVGGQLSDMSIAFTSTETSDVGQILSLLVAGSSARSAEETAQQAGGQAANFVAGLTAGLLTLTLRRELGDVGNVVPAVSIETAGTAGTLRARAYWDASVIIPDFLREVVVGASVEGFFTADQGSTGGGSAGSTGAGGGVTIELQFPYGIRSTGTYVPPQSWGADVLWQP
ncbi:MAG: translocation/assembly module TamB [Sandaracinaceae bacterium]|nr:translocation/assembly module TamB [Sandaracinaceae bacterium]